MARLTAAQAKKVYDAPYDDVVLSGIVKRQAQRAETHWGKDPYNLKDTRTKNKELYLSKYAKDRNPEEAIFADNRIFVATRSITPYLTARLTQPEITPADDTDLGLQFAKDFEKIIVQEAEDVQAKYKLRLAAGDLLQGQRSGWVKWSYYNGELCLEHIMPDKILVDGDTNMFEEPKFIQELMDMTVAKILRKFPHNEKQIIQWFGLTDTQGSPGWLEKLEQVKQITENWVFVDDPDKGEPQLITVWKYQENVLGASSDALYKQGANNIIDAPMMPYVWINFLSDGSGKIDETSFLEQAQYSQKGYERLGQAINDNTTFGISGVPVFAKDALEDDDVPKVKFAPNKRIVLDLKKTGASRITDAFTTWHASSVQNYVLEDKQDQRNNVDNTFGTPSIFRGEKADSNTLGQDTILRDQAEGRLQEPVDCIDLAMGRFFLLEAQFIWRYFTDDDYYRFAGDNGGYEQVLLTNDKLARNADISIRIQGGTNLPVDRSQKVATIVKLLELNKAPTLEAYKILGVFDDPDKAYKEFLLEQADPAAALADADKAIFSREAYEDLYAVIGGKVPAEREDIDPQYIQYLTDYLTTDKFRLLDPKQQQAVSQFAQMVQAKAQLKLAKLESMQPVQDPNAPQGAPGAPGQPPQPGQPGQPPQGPPSGAVGPGTPMTPPVTINLPQPIPAPGAAATPQGLSLPAAGALASLQH